MNPLCIGVSHAYTKLSVHFSLNDPGLLSFLFLSYKLTPKGMDLLQSPFASLAGMDTQAEHIGKEMVSL